MNRSRGVGRLAPLPGKLAGDREFEASWDEFIEYRKRELKKPMVKKEQESMLRRLAAYGARVAKLLLADSMSNGWKNVGYDGQEDSIAQILSGVGRRPPPTVDRAAARKGRDTALRYLASFIPEPLKFQISGLTAWDDDSEVYAELERIERAVVDEARASLHPEGLAAVKGEVDRIMGHLRPGADRPWVEGNLWRRFLLKDLGVPNNRLCICLLMIDWEASTGNRGLVGFDPNIYEERFMSKAS